MRHGADDDGPNPRYRPATPFARAPPPSPPRTRRFFKPSPTICRVLITVSGYKHVVTPENECGAAEEAPGGAVVEVHVAGRGAGASPAARAAARRGRLRRGRGERGVLGASSGLCGARDARGGTTPAARLRTTPRSAQRAFPSSTSNDAACLSARGGSVPNARRERPHAARASAISARAPPARVRNAVTDYRERMFWSSRRGSARPQTRHAVRSWLRFRLQDDAIDARNLIAGHRWRPFGHSVSAPKRRTRDEENGPNHVSQRVWAHSNLASLRGGACVVRGVAQRANAGRLRGKRFSRPGSRSASRLAAEADDLRDAPRGAALRKRPLGARRRGGMERGERAVSCGDDKQIARWNANGDAGGKVRRHAASGLARALSFKPLEPRGPPAPDLTRGRRRFPDLGASNGRGRRPSVRHPAGSKRARSPRDARRRRAIPTRPRRPHAR